MNTQPLTCGTRLSAGPTGQRDEIGEAHATAQHTAKFADGDSSGEMDSTGVITVMGWFYWCYRREIRPRGEDSSPMMAARQSSGVSCR